MKRVTREEIEKRYGYAHLPEITRIYLNVYFSEMAGARDPQVIKYNVTENTYLQDAYGNKKLINSEDKGTYESMSEDNVQEKLGMANYQATRELFKHCQYTGGNIYPSPYEPDMPADPMDIISTDYCWIEKTVKLLSKGKFKEAVSSGRLKNGELETTSSPNLIRSIFRLILLIFIQWAFVQPERFPDFVAKIAIWGEDTGILSVILIGLWIFVLATLGHDLVKGSVFRTIRIYLFGYDEQELKDIFDYIKPRLYYVDQVTSHYMNRDGEIVTYTNAHYERVHQIQTMFQEVVDHYQFKNKKIKSKKGLLERFTYGWLVWLVIIFIFGRFVLWDAFGDSITVFLKSFIYTHTDTIKMGSYEGKSLVWKVLDEKDGNLLVISVDGLQFMDFDNRDDKDKNICWENSDIRIWLNNDFLNECFSEDEKMKIIETTITNTDECCPDSFNGANTTDSIFLLSHDEALQYFESDLTRSCHMKWVNNHGHKMDGHYNWWLRNTTEKGKVYVINADGSVGSQEGIETFDYHLTSANSNAVVVRPVMWVSKEQ